MVEVISDANMSSRMKFEDEPLLKGKTPIQNFYYGSNILITGGTGFLGKVLIEKLLLTTEVNKMYLLIRTKKEKSVEERFKALFNQSAFDRLRKAVPNFKEKICFIRGDCSQPDLGLSTEDRMTVITNVNVIFHVAATVRFDEKLSLALGINVKGTRRIMELCSECMNLKSIVYVSTAYSNCIHSNIEEKIYEPPTDTDKMLKFVDETSDEELDKLTPEIIGKYPNTYTFSKALAEDMVKKHSENLPITIVRPSIVIASRKEPTPGWVDNFYGPSGALAGVGSGVLRTMQVNEDLRSDLVPVDMVVNSCIAAGWDTAQKRELKVLNYVSCGNPIKWEEYFYWYMHFGQMYPSLHSIWYYTFTLTKYKTLAWVYRIILHFIPGLLIDLVLVLSNNKPKMIKTYMKIDKFCDVLTYFANNEWNFNDDNVQALWNKMSEQDQKMYHFNIRDVEWDIYAFESIKTIRRLLLNEKDETLVEARKRMYRLKILHQTLKHTFMILGLYFLYFIALKIYFMFW